MESCNVHYWCAHADHLRGRSQSHGTHMSMASFSFSLHWVAWDIVYASLLNPKLSQLSSPLSMLGYHLILPPHQLAIQTTIRFTLRISGGCFSLRPPSPFEEPLSQPVTPAVPDFLSWR